MISFSDTHSQVGGFSDTYTGINGREGVVSSSLECPGWVRKVSSGLAHILGVYVGCPVSIVESSREQTLCSERHTVPKLVVLPRVVRVYSSLGGCVGVTQKVKFQNFWPFQRNLTYTIGRVPLKIRMYMCVIIR